MGEAKNIYFTCLNFYLIFETPNQYQINHA